MILLNLIIQNECKSTAFQELKNIAFLSSIIKRIELSYQSDAWRFQECHFFIPCSNPVNCRMHFVKAKKSLIFLERPSKKATTTTKKTENKSKAKRPPTPTFPNNFEHVADLFLYQKLVPHKPFTLLKLCYLSGSIFFVGYLFPLSYLKQFFFLCFFSDFSYEIIYAYKLLISGFINI